MADPLADAVRRSYATGWALSGGPMTPRVKAGCEAAVTEALRHRGDPRILEVTLDLGHLEGTWAEVYRRREDLTAARIAQITRIWRRLVRRLDVKAFAAGWLHQARMPREAAAPQDKAAAAGALLAWLRQILDDPGYADLAAAITTALADAMAEGRTALLAVAADQAKADGFDWDTAYAAMRAAYADLEADPDIAGPVIQAILSGVAWNAGQALAAAIGSAATDAEAVAAAADAIDGADVAGLDLAVDTAMGQAMGQGALALAAAEGIQLNWMSAGDERVCYKCEANEAGGPYDPGDFPDLPAHPRCRCCSSPAAPLAISAFADFLVS